MKKAPVAEQKKEILIFKDISSMSEESEKIFKFNAEHFKKQAKLR